MLLLIPLFLLISLLYCFTIYNSLTKVVNMRCLKKCVEAEQHNHATLMHRSWSVCVWDSRLSDRQSRSEFRWPPALQDIKGNQWERCHRPCGVNQFELKYKRSSVHSIWGIMAIFTAYHFLHHSIILSLVLWTYCGQNVFVYFKGMVTSPE